METTKKPLIIAVDGPAGAGKGTLSRRIADFYNLGYLDTGVLYRGVGWVMLSKGLEPDDATAAMAVARAFCVTQIEGSDIRTTSIAAAASIVAAHEGVRYALLEYQRAYARQPAAGKRGAVLDGRDIGTVVVPDARIKLYVTATPEIRAHRRWLELSTQDKQVTKEQILREINHRDARDASRKSAPLKPAPDALLLDTTSLDIDTTFAAACRMIDQALEA